MARVFNEDDSSDDEIAGNLRLAQRLRINRENGILEDDTSIEDSKEMKQISNLHRKIFAQNGQSSSSSSVELQSDNASGINGSDHYFNKKRQNGDKNIEQSANPKRTCLSDRIHKAPEWRDSKKKGNRSHPKSVKVNEPSQVSAGFHFDDSDSDFEYPPKAIKKPAKTNKHTLENPHSSSSSVESAQLPNFESKPSTSKFSHKGFDSYRNDESKAGTKNGTLKGARQESSNQSTTSKRLFGRYKKNKILDSDDSEEEIRTPFYRTRPLVFSSSDTDSDFKPKNKYSNMQPLTMCHELDFEDGYPSPRPNRAIRFNHKSNKKAHAMPSNRADSSDGCESSFLPSDFQCKPTTSRSGRARRNSRMNITTSLTNGFFNGNSSSAPVRGRRNGGADRGSRHSGSPHYRNTASRDSKSRARTSSSRTKQDKSSIAARYPDAEESDNEFFTANSYSDTETSTAESLGGVTINASFPNHGTISCSIDCDRDGTSDDEVRVVFSTGPSVRNNDSRRGASRTLGRRLYRGTPHRQHQSVHEVVSLSPDPVEQVRQMEEDERMAGMLQAQFDAEMIEPDYNPTTSQLFPAEPQEASDIEEEILDPDGDDTDSPDTDADPNSVHYSVPFDGIFSGPRFMLHRVNRPQGFTHNASAIPAAYFGNNRRYSRNRRRLNFGPPRESPEIHIAQLFGIGFPGMGELFTAGGDDYEALLSLDLAGDVPRGLHKSDINRLPTRKFVHPNSTASACSSETRHKRTELNKECQVCLTDYETGDVLRILPCFHEFHTPCIDPWLKINQTCPVCRVTVDLDS